MNVDPREQSVSIHHLADAVDHHIDTGQHSPERCRDAAYANRELRRYDMQRTLNCR